MKRALVVAIMLIVSLVASSAAIAYTEYTPTWSVRLYAPYDNNTLPAETADSVTANSSYVFTLATFEVSATKSRNITVSVIDPSDGSRVEATNIYGNGLNLTGWEIEARQSPYIYVAGTFLITSNNRRGGFILALYHNLSIMNESLIYDRNGVEDYTIYGLCRDADGNVYATGYIYNPARKIYNMSIIIAPSDLSTAKTYYISYASEGYNATGLKCTYGYDGYVYFVGQLFIYDTQTNNYYPVYDVVIKLDPQQLSIVDSTRLDLRNSQNYVTNMILFDADIAANDTALALAIGYTDENPSPTSPTSGAAVIVMDHDLNVKFKKSVTTGYYEEFSAIMMGGDGSILVGGRTNYDYGTGLGTSYYHSLALILNKDGSLSKALLYGATDAGSAISDVLIAPDGSLYLATNHFSDSISFYDITTDITVQQVGGTVSKGSAIKFVPKYEPGEPVLHPLNISNVVVGTSSIIASKPRLSEQLTPNGDSSALLVKLTETLQPPLPVPEPATVVIAAVAVTATLICFTRKVKR